MTADIETMNHKPPTIPTYLWVWIVGPLAAHTIILATLYAPGPWCHAARSAQRLPGFMSAGLPDASTTSISLQIAGIEEQHVISLAICCATGVALSEP